MNQQFADDLKELYTRHGVFMAANGKLTPLQDYKEGSLTVTVKDSISYGNGVVDRSGLFVVPEIEQKEMPKPKGVKASAAFQIIDKEKPLGGDAIESPVDGKMYTNRASYDRHLKENGCHVVDDSRKRTFDKADKMRSAQQEALSASNVDWQWS